MIIGQDVIQKIQESVVDLLETYQKELNATTEEYSGVDVVLIWFDDCFGNRYGRLLCDVLIDEDYTRQQSCFSVLYARTETLFRMFSENDGCAED